MKIHVISAGKSITDGRDYHWNDDIIPDGIQPMQAMLNEQSGKYYSLVIAKGPGSGYSVFMARLPLVSGARDDLRRPLCAGFLIRGLSNEEARKLAIEYVENKTHLAQILCTPAVIKTAADFTVDSEAAEKAVRELLSGELPDGSTPVTVGELWGESSAWERREELLGWLKNHRLSDRSGNRVILCYFTDPERLSGEEDLVLHYSDQTYTKELRKPQRSGGCPLKRFLPGLPDKPWMQAALGTIVAALLIWGIAKSCSSSPHTEVPSEPTPKATDVPTLKPADVPATVPTDVPTPEPTVVPTPEPSDVPTPEPSDGPTPGPSDVPTPEPTVVPTPEPSDVPTPVPSDGPTPEPSDVPTPVPSDGPTPEPTDVPTPVPSDVSTPKPTDEPAPKPSDVSTSESTPYPAPETTDAPHTADEQGGTHLPTTEENSPTE
ncbi:MAG: hypothetical protein ACI4OZ_08645 [Akkermansia sp.]